MWRHSSQRTEFYPRLWLGPGNFRAPLVGKMRSPTIASRKGREGREGRAGQNVPAGKKLLTFNFVFMFCFFILRADPMTERAFIVGGAVRLRSDERRQKAEAQAVKGLGPVRFCDYSEKTFGSGVGVEQVVARGLGERFRGEFSE